MRTQHLTISTMVAGLTLVAGIVAVAGCGSSQPGAGGTGASGSGGAANTGGTHAMGGTTGGTGGTGPAGTTGTAGATGAAGTIGTAGTTGAAGTTGTAGATGIAGTTGTGGTTGTAGTAGTTGSGGRGGTSGSAGRGGAGGGTAGGTGGSAVAGRGGSGGGIAGTTGTAGRGGGAGTSSGTCTASNPVSTNASGTGPHKVIVETNSDSGIAEGTIFRPMDLGGAEKYPIFAWGEGGCLQNGLSNAAVMGEIASHGYFVIADGTPNGTSSGTLDGSDTAAMGKPLLAYIAWAIAENDKPCSAYYQSLDTTKIATNGFSCGGLMAEGTAGDPRITTWGLNSSGLFSADQALYKTVHTPVLIVLGGSERHRVPERREGLRRTISALGIPIMLFSKTGSNHGGDLVQWPRGDFAKIDLAWLNWWLKGDETATGKGVLVGSSCTVLHGQRAGKSSRRTSSSQDRP